MTSKNTTTVSKSNKKASLSKPIDTAALAKTGKGKYVKEEEKAGKKGSKKNWTNDPNGLTCVQIAENLMKEYDTDLEPMKRIVRIYAKRLGFDIPVGRNGRRFSKADQHKIIRAIAEVYEPADAE